MVSEADREAARQKATAIMDGLVPAARWKASVHAGQHEYTTRAWCKVIGLEASFIAAVVAIREAGNDRRYLGHPYRYFDHGGYTYWTMGAPVDQTIILNRRKKTTTEDLRPWQH